MLALKECLRRESGLNFVSGSANKDPLSSAMPPIKITTTTTTASLIVPTGDSVENFNNLVDNGKKYPPPYLQRHRSANYQLAGCYGTTSNSNTNANRRRHHQKSVGSHEFDIESNSASSNNLSSTTASATANTSCQLTQRTNENNQQSLPASTTTTTTTTTKRYQGHHPHFHHHTAPVYYTDVKLRRDSTPGASSGGSGVGSSLNENYKSVYATPTKLVVGERQFSRERSPPKKSTHPAAETTNRAKFFRGGSAGSSERKKPADGCGKRSPNSVCIPAPLTKGDYPTHPTNTSNEQRNSRNAQRFSGRKRAVRVRSESRPISALYDIICKEKGLDIGTTSNDDGSTSGDDQQQQQTQQQSQQQRMKQRGGNHKTSNGSPVVFGVMSSYGRDYNNASALAHRHTQSPAASRTTKKKKQHGSGGLVHRPGSLSDDMDSTTGGCHEHHIPLKACPKHTNLPQLAAAQAGAATQGNATQGNGASPTHSRSQSKASFAMPLPLSVIGYGEDAYQRNRTQHPYQSQPLYVEAFNASAGGATTCSYSSSTNASPSSCPHHCPHHPAASPKSVTAALKAASTAASEAAAHLDQHFNASCSPTKLYVEPVRIQLSSSPTSPTAATRRLISSSPNANGSSRCSASSSKPQTTNGADVPSEESPKKGASLRNGREKRRHTDGGAAFNVALTADNADDYAADNCVVVDDDDAIELDMHDKRFITRSNHLTSRGGSHHNQQQQQQQQEDEEEEEEQETPTTSTCTTIINGNAAALPQQQQQQPTEQDDYSSDGDGLYERLVVATAANDVKDCLTAATTTTTNAECPAEAPPLPLTQPPPPPSTAHQEPHDSFLVAETSSTLTMTNSGDELRQRRRRHQQPGTCENSATPHSQTALHALQIATTTTTITSQPLRTTQRRLNVSHKEKLKIETTSSAPPPAPPPATTPKRQQKLVKNCNNYATPTKTSMLKQKVRNATATPTTTTTTTKANDSQRCQSQQQQSQQQQQRNKLPLSPLIITTTTTSTTMPKQQQQSLLQHHHQHQQQQQFSPSSPNTVHFVRTTKTSRLRAAALDKKHRDERQVRFYSPPTSPRHGSSTQPQQLTSTTITSNLSSQQEQHHQTSHQIMTNHECPMLDSVSASTSLASNNHQKQQQQQPPHSTNNNNVYQFSTDNQHQQQQQQQYSEMVNHHHKDSASSTSSTSTSPTYRPTKSSTLTATTVTAPPPPTTTTTKQQLVPSMVSVSMRQNLSELHFNGGHHNAKQQHLADEPATECTVKLCRGLSTELLVPPSPPPPSMVSLNKANVDETKAAGSVVVSPAASKRCGHSAAAAATTAATSSLVDEAPRDKSSKRKSNLNRSLNEEATQDGDESSAVRRRRRRELGMSRTLIPAHDNADIQQIITPQHSAHDLQANASSSTLDLNGCQQRASTASPGHVGSPVRSNRMRTTAANGVTRITRRADTLPMGTQRTPRSNDVNRKFNERTRNDLAVILQIAEKANAHAHDDQVNGGEAAKPQSPAAPAPALPLSELPTTAIDKLCYSIGSLSLTRAQLEGTDRVEGAPTERVSFRFEGPVYFDSASEQTVSGDGAAWAEPKVSQRPASGDDVIVLKPAVDTVPGSGSRNLGAVLRQCMLKARSVERDAGHETPRLSPILRRKSTDDPLIHHQTMTTVAAASVSTIGHGHIVSILKKKDHHLHIGNDSSSASSNASPVTFSANVLDTPIKQKRAGILKKRSSLDESRYYSRSHSPDERSILIKSARRNSLEELAASSSSTVLGGAVAGGVSQHYHQQQHQHHHGILKQSSYDSSKSDGCPSATESHPHGILKKKDSTSTPSDGGSHAHKHVSISQAVILAAAELGGRHEEGVPLPVAGEFDDATYTPNNEEYEIRPILKLESTSSDDAARPPKPILKKKSSGDSDEHEIRPILKTSRKSSREEFDFEGASCSDTNDMRPILKTEATPSKRRSLFEEDGHHSEDSNTTLTPSNCSLLKRRTRSLERQEPRVVDLAEALNAIASTSQTTLAMPSSPVPPTPPPKPSKVKSPPATMPPVELVPSTEAIMSVADRIRNMEKLSKDCRRSSLPPSSSNASWESPMQSAYPTAGGGGRTFKIMKPSVIKRDTQRDRFNTLPVTSDEKSCIFKSSTPSQRNSNASIFDTSATSAFQPTVKKSHYINGDRIEHQSNNTATTTTTTNNSNSNITTQNNDSNNTQINPFVCKRSSINATQPQPIHQPPHNPVRHQPYQTSSQLQTVDRDDHHHHADDQNNGDSFSEKLNISEQLTLSVGSDSELIFDMSSSLMDQPATEQDTNNVEGAAVGAATVVRKNSVRDRANLFQQLQEKETTAAASPRRATAAAAQLRFTPSPSMQALPADPPQHGHHYAIKRSSSIATNNTNASFDDRHSLPTTPLTNNHINNNGYTVSSPAAAAAVLTNNNNNNQHNHNGHSAHDYGAGGENIVDEIGSTDIEPVPVLPAAGPSTPIGLKGILKSKSGVGPMPFNLNAELQNRLKPSPHAAVSNLRKSCTASVMGGGGSGVGASPIVSQHDDAVSLVRNLSNLGRPQSLGAVAGAADLTAGACASTSEGESSGGREINEIIKNSAVTRRRKLNDGSNLIAKSKSHSAVPPVGGVALFGLPQLPPLSSGAFAKLRHVGAVGGAADTQNNNSNNNKPSKFKEANNEEVQPTKSQDLKNDNKEDSDEGAVELRRPPNALPSFLQGGLRRCKTQDMGPDQRTITVSKTGTIADRLAALQKSGEDDWKRRASKQRDEVDEIRRENIVNESISLAHSLSDKPLGPSPLIPTSLEGGKVAERLGKLKTSSEGWKNRVELSDASKFTVAGRLQKKSQSPIEIQLQRTTSDAPKKCPMLVVRSANPPQLGLAKSPSMMVTGENRPANGKSSLLQRSLSVNDEVPSDDGQRNGGNSSNSDTDSDKADKENTTDQTSAKKIVASSRSVVVHRMDDEETFEKFFSGSGIARPTKSDDAPKVEIADFDCIQRSSERLVTKRAVQGPKGRRTARNPLKTLAARSDISSEYTEVRTGVAEREMRRIQMEAHGGQQRSNLAAEAIAGLASVEDFKSVALRSSSLPLNQLWLPYKPVMLLHVKGRSHIQTRLVEPVYTSVNRGDCFILVAGSQLYRYVGSFANIIEMTRAKKICSYILENKDLGCTANRELILQDGKQTSVLGGDRSWSKFWEILGKPADYEVPHCGHADEDELFESSLIETNKIYEYQDETLVPLDKWWGSLPRVHMLDSRKVLVFDFGSEMYVWNGKNAAVNAKRAAIKLAQEHFGDAHTDYTQCYLNPINYAAMAGDRGAGKLLRSDKRGDWCILGKITQNMETSLFKEKFADWPEVERGQLAKDYLTSGVHQVTALDGAVLHRGEPYEEPNLMLEQSSLGRGSTYYDADTMRHFDVISVSIDKWRINECSYDDTSKALYGHFYSAETYIVRWMYQISVSVHELTGCVSSRSTVGRDRCVYFCWQGNDASTNEKGTAALLTVELDKEKGAQLRVGQGEEMPAFVRLFELMFQHRGHKDECLERRNEWRLYQLLGNVLEETILIEVDCSARQLRSRASMLLVHGAQGRVVVWHGCKSAPHSRLIADKSAEWLHCYPPEDLFSCTDLKDVETYEEGQQSNDDVMEAFGDYDAAVYGTLLHATDKEYNYTPRLFQFSSTKGVFSATELTFALRHKTLITPYPFSQSQLYEARQPTSFLFDDDDVLWMWMGWWPLEGINYRKSSTEERSSPTSDNRAGVNRWISERRAALQTAVSYWHAKHGDCNACNEPFHGIKGYVVWAGLEPLAFKALFPDWTDREDVREINQLDGRTDELLPIDQVLQQLTQTEYPLEVLKQRPLPEGVDPTRLELYLSYGDFVKAFDMSPSDFEQLPLWKQTNLKKEHGFF